DIYLSPLFLPIEGSTLKYEVLSRSPKNIKLYFSLGIFPILSDINLRKELLNDIVEHINPLPIIQQNIINNENNEITNVIAENIGQLQNRTSSSLQVST
ncbi:hypothetical protein K2X92_03720, partial [Candidatus Gracilibacteria bacterium]|nr:hypothetical protein [Candidatus Gracilibacteria bacterium]